MRRLTVVVAACDEEANVEPLTRRLHAVLSSLPGWEWEVLYVVEGTDDTRTIVERLAAELGHVRLLYNEAPSGLGAAFQRGFAAVPEDVDVVVTMDADLNHQPEEIPSLLAALERTGSDIVVGSRFVSGSSVRGTPLWKRLPSGTMNLLMHYLYGVEVRDKTSGFRAYRAAALRSIRFQNRRFAFLPEMLILASRQGLAIAEVPIHFVFRREGRSKLRFWPTSLSYLALLRTSFDRVSLLALGAYLAALVVRLTAAFPAHKHPADADALLAGLCAFKVLRGETPVFFSPVRIGSLECHLAAPLLALGPSRPALLLTALLLNLAFLVAAHLFFREALGRAMAAVALLALAVPAPAVVFWTYVPNGYPAVLALCAVVLWLAARLARTGGSWPALGLGLAVGLGVWHSLLTLAASGPALLWLALHRGGRARSPRVVALVLAGLLAGASPWLAFNLRWQWYTFAENFASRPARGSGAMADNAAYLWAENIPELLGSDDVVEAEMPPLAAQRALRPIVLAIWGAAFAVLLLAPLLPARLSPGLPRASWALLVLVVAAVVALNVTSEAGQVRGLTVRYVLPLAIPAAAALAALAAVLWRLRRELAVAAVGCVMAFDLAGHPWPWRAGREKWRRYTLEDRRLLAVLGERGIDVAVGGYWTVYPLTFLSRERVVGVPCEPLADHYGYGRKLPDRPLRWAFVAWSHPGQESWIDLAAVSGALTGAFERAAPGFVVYYPEPNPPAAPAAEFLATVRDLCHVRPY